MIAVSILVYSVCNSLISSEEGSVSIFRSDDVNAFAYQVSVDTMHSQSVPEGYMVSFLPTTQMWL